MRPLPDDTQQLRRCVRDLVALATLPAVWSNAGPRTIADSLAEVMVRILSLDFVYARVRGRADGPAVEAAYSLGRAETPGRAREIGQALGPWLAFDRFYAPPSVPSPVGGEPARLAVLPLGLGQDYGLLAAGSGRPDFPTEPERLLLRVGANQAAVALQRHEAEAKLQEADRLKDEFLATLAHELRNPLAPIRNALQILRLGGGKPEIAQTAHDMMERQLQHMVRLVDDLLDLSRISRGKVELRKERIELAAVLHNAVETSRPLIEAAGHRLTVNVPAERVWLEADATRMAQVVANLLNNAAKYTKPGGAIWLTAEQAGNEAVIGVRDTGIGIPAAMLPRIFEMFAQVETALERSQGGLGIGLTLVKTLVEMHQGSVEAHSAGPGQGSEFVVRLPAAGRPGAQAPDGPAARPAPSPGRRILIVDDNVDAAESLGMFLNLLGNETRLAHDGRDVLEAAGAFVPDVVVLDIGLPGMNGYEVARQIRQRPDLRDVLLVAITGWGQEEDRRRCLEAGFDHHLTKPADLGALEQLLGSLPSGR